MGVHAGHMFDEKRCGTVKKIVTNETKAEDLVGVTWVVGELRFGREYAFSYGDDDWHSVDEDVPGCAGERHTLCGRQSYYKKYCVDDENAQLTTLAGFDGITTVGGDLRIDDTYGAEMFER